MWERVAVLAILPLVAAATPAAAQRQTTSVTGVVLDDRGATVTGITVRLVDPLGAALRTGTTDDQGRFQFGDVPSGRFAVEAHTRRGRPVRVPVAIEGALPVEVTLRLPPALAESVQVTAAANTAPSTFSSLAGATLSAVPTRVRGRSLQDAVATLPGWSTEDNGLLHTRGVDDGFLYVIDGIPVYERLDTLNGIAPDVASLDAVTIVTGYVPPEFGYKAGGVIEVRSAEARSRWNALGDVGAGSFSTADGGLATGGTLGDRIDLRLGGSAQRSDRFLDPAHPDNLHNAGSSGALFGHIAYRSPTQDRLRVALSGGRTRYDVPNTVEQEEARQDQRQRVSLGLVDTSWQRTWSDRTVTQVAVYHRRSSAALEGSEFDTPVFASADRSLVRTGGIAALTHQRGAHVLKAGIELQALTLDEAFGFFVTDEEMAEEAGLSEEALGHDADDPFEFASGETPTLTAVYLQDSWQAGPSLTVAAGVRFDRSTMLLDRSQWSPRMGASYRIGSATVLRGSVSRFFQPPQPEYLLLSSSAEARELSPFVTEEGAGGSDVEPERQWAFEAGAERRFRRWRLDAAYWRRAIREAADPNVFFGTTIIFPNAVAKGRAHGVDLRLEAPRWQGWSGYASTSIGRVIQTGPVTGGLFLEDEVAEIGPGDEFTPDHDQRVTIAGGVTWEHARSGLTLSIGGRHESGTPLQRDDDDAEELEKRPGADMVDFDRGRVKPRTLVSVVGVLPIVRADGLRLDVRGSVLNLFDDDYAYNFGNPFSGTHFGAPRSVSVSVVVTLR